MGIKELSVSIVWGASAVSVASFTWEAFTQTRDSNGQSKSSISQIGGGDFTPKKKSKQRPPRSVAPPKGLQRQLQTAVISRNPDSVRREWQRITVWGAQNNATPAQLQGWVKGQAWYPAFQRSIR